MTVQNVRRFNLFSMANANAWCFTVWERSNFYSSPAIEYSIDNALKAAGLTKDEVECYDFYSLVARA